jgi:hypothetical protein
VLYLVLLYSPDITLSDITVLYSPDCGVVLYVRVIFCCWASPTHTSHLAPGHHFCVSRVRSVVAAL